MELGMTIRRRGKKELVEQVCEVCGTTFWVWRPMNRMRGGGHEKRLWCTVCGKRTNHLQMREMDK